MTTTVVAPTIVADTATVEVTSECYGDRYWVGGTGNWSDDTNHWARSSNGSPGLGNLPNEWCNVFIDANSGFGGGGTISTDGTDGSAVCNDFNSISGNSYTIEYTSSRIYVYGSAVFESGLTFDDTSQSFVMFVGSGLNSITCNGADIYYLYINGDGSWVLQDDLIATEGVEIVESILDINDNDIDCAVFIITGDSTLYMGSGTINLSGGVDEYFDIEYIGLAENHPIIYSETSTIKIGGSISGYKELQSNFSDTITLNKVWFTNTESSISIVGNYVINELKIDTPPHTVKFKEGTTTTVTTFTVSGTVGNLITLDSSNGSDQFTLSKTSGVVACDYLDLSNSNATGGATWYAGSHSNDTDNNDGWIFSDPP